MPLDDPTTWEHAATAIKTAFESINGVLNLYKGMRATFGGTRLRDVQVRVSADTDENSRLFWGAPT
jgi:hypothetical protein